MKRISLVKSLALMMVFSAGMSLAVKAEAFRRLPPPHILTAVAGKIGIKDAVLNKIKKLAFETRKKMISLRAKLELARLELHQSLDNRNTAESTIIAKVEKLGALKAALMKNRILMLFRIKKLLTPAQEKKLNALRAERRLHHGRRGRWGRGHGWGRRGRGGSHGWGRRGRGRGHGWGHRGKGGRGPWGGPPPMLGGPKPPDAPHPPGK